MDIGLIDTDCRYCNERCFVPITIQARGDIILAFANRKVNMTPTCDEGQRTDKALIGFCYGDIIKANPNYLKDLDITKTIARSETWRKLYVLKQVKKTGSGGKTGFLAEVRGRVKAGMKFNSWLTRWLIPSTKR